MANKEIIRAAFQKWTDGAAYISEIFADEMRWTIAGHSFASRTYLGKQAFIAEVLQPFGARFQTPFRPVLIKGIYEDGDTVIVHWDGEGVAKDGVPYKNTYAWIMRMQDGLVVEATAFYDSISFNELWTRITPA